MSVLVLADLDQGRLNPATARVVAAAAALGPVDVLVADQQPGGAAAEAAAIAGVGKVLLAGSAILPDASPTAISAVLAQLAPRYTHIVATAATTGRDVIPRLAAVLDIMPVTDVIEILGPDRFVRPIYAGNALETIHSPQDRQLLTVRPAAFRPAPGGGSAPVEDVEIPAVAGDVALLAAHRSEGARPDLSTAQIVVAGGVSFGSAENFQRLAQLADRLGAAIGATRAAVDAGYAPNDWQVGQTGKIIAPELYIAIGISGALQHLAGIQGARKIVAVNTDPEAPLMKLADLALVADLNDAVPALIAELDRLSPAR